MVKRVICFAGGGHISNQNVSFRKLQEILEPKGYEFYGARNGFEAFETGEYCKLDFRKVSANLAGFYAGAGRYSLTDKNTKEIIPERLEKATDFFRLGRFDIGAGSGGDDHGKQIAIMAKTIPNVGFYVHNKTMDGDLGGIDGRRDAPYTDCTNGFHTAVSSAVRQIHHHYAGAWTNDCPTIITLFGRDTNWVSAAVAYWSSADKIIYGELPSKEAHEGHHIERIYNLIVESQDKNEKKYGRRFAAIIVPEGTRIKEINHIDENAKDIHGNNKLMPKVLSNRLEELLKENYNLKVNSVVIDYLMRDSPPTPQDVRLGNMSAKVIADAILRGESGVESTFKIKNGKIHSGVAPIERVSEKRFMRYYPKRIIDEGTFEVTEEMGRYYEPLFGPRKRLSNLLPQKIHWMKV